MEPKRPVGPRASRARREAPATRPSNKTLVLLIVGAVVTLVGVVCFYWFVLSDRTRHYEMPVDWPQDSPHGDPVHVAYELKAGDIFVTDFRFESGVVLGFGQGDPMGGMRLDGKMLFAQEVVAKPTGGLRSVVRVLLERCDATYPPMKEAVWDALRDRVDPYAVEFDRDEAGRPLIATAGGPKARESQRAMLERITSGLADVSSNYLPGRDVRLGETWDLASVANVPHILDVVRYVAGTEGKQGWPAGEQRGRVAAEAVETREGEECLRLGVYVSTTMEGDVVAPQAPGRVTTAARIRGNVWVSLKTGIVWGLDLTADLKSSYLVKDRAQDRLARQHLTASTKRATELPK